MSESFDPYHEWLGIPPAEQPPNHYRLLGVTLFESKPTVIETAADQRMMLLRTFQTGKHSGLSQKLLNEVAAAKICLLKPAEKAAYDATLQGQLSRKSPPSVPEPPMDRELAAMLSQAASRPIGKRPPAARRKPHVSFVMIGGVAAMLLLGMAMIWATGSTRSGLPDRLAEQGERRTVEGEVRSAPAAERREGTPTARTSHPAIVGKQEGPGARLSAGERPKSGPEKPAARLQSKHAAVLEVKAEPKLEPPSAQPAETVGADSKTSVPAPPQRTTRTPSMTAARAPVVPPATTSAQAPPAAAPPIPPGEAPEPGEAAATLAGKGEALRTLIKSARTSEERKAGVEQMVSLIGEAVATEQFAGVDELAKLAVAEAVKLRDKELLQQARACKKDSEDAARAFGRVEGALAALKRNPDDPEANLAVGKYRCLVKNDWRGGLPYLAKSSDERMRAVARQELDSPPTAPDEQVALADAWWDLAHAKASPEREQFLFHANAWHEKAAPWIDSEPVKGRLRKRLGETAKIAAADRSNSSLQHVNLLSWVDLERDRVEGEWARSGTAIVTPTAVACSRVMLPLMLRGDYDLSLVLTRQKGESIGVFLPVDTRKLLLWLRADGFHLSGGEGGFVQAVRVSLPGGQRNAILAKIRTKEEQVSVEIWRNGAAVLRWRGKKDDLVPPPHCWRLPKPRAIGLAAHLSVVAIDSVQLRTILGQVTWAWPESSKPRPHFTADAFELR